MKRNALLAFVLLLSLQLHAQFSSQNISMYANWFNPNVVQEPGFHIKYNSVWGWKNTAQNKEYAIVGSSGGTFFVDVTNPSNPIECDFVAGRRSNCILLVHMTPSHAVAVV